MAIKNPCLHPGDLRRLYAVDHPSLHHLYNCIVFPRVGSRPHTTEISGSDLDGDNFFVYWDEQLILASEYKPGDFPATTGDELLEVTQKDVINFWLEFIKNDSLGIIANSHAALADYLPEKALDEKCLELCTLHSEAVDFPKTGAKPVVPKELKPERWPHYMEKKDKEAQFIYHSQTVIGKLYDTAKT